MLIGGDEISNDVHTLSTCFSMFVYIRTCFCFALIGGNLTAQSTGSATGGLEVQFKFQSALKLSFLFPPHCQSTLHGELARRLSKVVIKKLM